MKTAKQRLLEDLRRGLDAMYREYLESCDTDKDRAAYAWKTYQRLDEQIEQIEQLEAK